jgi:hypothetical protein
LTYKPKHGFTFHCNNHSATIKIIQYKNELVTFDLEDRCSTY